MKHIIALVIFLFVALGCTQQQPAQQGIPTTQTVTIEESVMPEQNSPDSRVVEMRIEDNIIEPAEIRVKQGDVVTLSISTLFSPEERNDEEVSMDDRRETQFLIDELGVSEVLYEGGPTIVRFTADKKGEFTYGDDTHLQAKGVLIVE